MFVLLLLPYPVIDPVLTHVGPLSVGWYALAYILGILLGWVYARPRRLEGPIWRSGRLADITTAVAPIGLFLVRLTNFIKPELWGRPTNVPRR